MGSFHMRYGLLYLGYREGREWWEVVIAMRKIAIVAIGTFGALFGAVDLQAYLALLVVFFSVVTHLVGQPYDTSKKHMVLLHQLEFIGLIVCFATFWGGLVFYLGSDVINDTARIVMSICIVLGNSGFLICCCYYFFRELIKELRNPSNAEITRPPTHKKRHALTDVVPINDPLNLDEGDTENENENETSVHVSAGLSADEQRLKELNLQKEIQKKKKKKPSKKKKKKKKKKKS